MKNELAAWKSKNLSWSGRTTPVSSLPNNIPRYATSLFKAHASICDKIGQSAGKFWWGHSPNDKLHALCRPKRCGGVGSRRAAGISRVMLPKSAWN